MTTKVKQAKMTWSPDEPGTIWGFTTEGKPGPTASYFIRQSPNGQIWAGVYPPKRFDYRSQISLGHFPSTDEAKTACAVDALKYL